MIAARRTFSIAAGGLAAGLALVGVALTSSRAPALLLVNETPSLPRGLYVDSLDRTPSPGRIVALEPPAGARRYLSALGMPRSVLLLKRVVAASGEAVCAREGRLVWPRGRALTLARDRRGTALAAWSGCRRLAADELLVMGDTPLSFDSRYFGPVRRAQVRGVYVEALAW